MNIFIWANGRTGSNNGLIVDTLVSEHNKKGDTIFTLNAESASFDEASIKNYQDELKKADFVYFTYPVHWGSYPNMFKKTVDSILTYGYAYEYSAEGMPVALLTGKKAKIITTAGHPNEYYVEQLKAIHYLAEKTILGFTGIESIGAINFGGRTRDKVEGFPIEELVSFINK